MQLFYDNCHITGISKIWFNFSDFQRYRIFPEFYSHFNKFFETKFRMLCNLFNIKEVTTFWKARRSFLSGLTLLKTTFRLS